MIDFPAITRYSGGIGNEQAAEASDGFGGLFGFLLDFIVNGGG